MTEEQNYEENKLTGVNLKKIRPIDQGYMKEQREIEENHLS